MWQKIKDLLDSRSTWLAIGAAAGVFGQHAAEIVSGLGAVVMAIL